MKEGEFDFNTYSKTKLSKEETDEIYKKMKSYFSLCINEKRKQFYSLPNDESKINWLKKAIVNCAALNSLIEEFLPPLTRTVPDQEIEEAQFKEILAEHIEHVSYHMGVHMTGIYVMKFFCEKARTEKEEIEKLKEMMK